ncbi:uncharacterized protein RB166_018001 isoform 1-T1 [Leptodactylus fuscus]
MSSAAPEGGEAAQQSRYSPETGKILLSAPRRDNEGQPLEEVVVGHHSGFPNSCTTPVRKPQMSGPSKHHMAEADALRCRQSSCTGSRQCSRGITVNCRAGADYCFVMMKAYPTFMMTRGCTTDTDCQIMKAFEPSTVCCTKDLCN